MESKFEKNVYKVVGRIPKGKVATYGQVAHLAGSPRAARAVGNLMKKNPHPKNKVPCHRVVASTGVVGGYALGPAKKLELLSLEGVVVKDGKIDLAQYSWDK